MHEGPENKGPNNVQAPLTRREFFYRFSGYSDAIKKLSESAGVPVLPGESEAWSFSDPKRGLENVSDFFLAPYRLALKQYPGLPNLKNLVGNTSLPGHEFFLRSSRLATNRADRIKLEERVPAFGFEGSPSIVVVADNRIIKDINELSEYNSELSKSVMQLIYLHELLHRALFEHRKIIPKQEHHDIISLVLNESVSGTIGRIRAFGTTGRFSSDSLRRVTYFVERDLKTQQH